MNTNTNRTTTTPICHRSLLFHVHETLITRHLTGPPQTRATLLRAGELLRYHSDTYRTWLSMWNHRAPTAVEASSLVHVVIVAAQNLSRTLERVVVGRQNETTVAVEAALVEFDRVVDEAVKTTVEGLILREKEGEIEPATWRRGNGF